MIIKRKKRLVKQPKQPASKKRRARLCVARARLKSRRRRADRRRRALAATKRQTAGRGRPKPRLKRLQWRYTMESGQGKGAVVRVPEQTMARLQLANMLHAAATPVATRKVAKRRSGSDGKQQASASSSSTASSSNRPQQQQQPCGNRANVSQLCPGWTASASASSRPPRGQLIFDASFESGNLESVLRVNDCEYELQVRGDTLNARYKVWFYFSVENVRNNQRVVFRIVNYSKLTTLFDKGQAAPVVRSSKQPKWRRLPERQVLCSNEAAAQRPAGTLSFCYLFDDTKSVFEFALCFPYTYTRLQKHLGSTCSRDRRAFVRRQQLTLSVQHRLVDLLVIGDNVDAAPNRPTVVVTARVHPGETPASFVCQGLIDFLVSCQPEAVELRGMFTFLVVPMLNPDGVCHGNYRCSSQGQDLNRQWTQPSALLQPSIHATKQLLLDANNNRVLQQQAPVVLYLDLHGHTQRQGAFIYGNIYDSDMLRCHRQFVFPQLLAGLAPDFDMAATQLNTDPSKESTSRRVFAELLDADTLCYTLEVSLFSYTQLLGNSAFPHTVPYTEDAYISLGANVGRAILHFGQVQRGQRVCVLQPMKKQRLTASNNLVLTTKLPVANTQINKKLRSK